MDKYLLEDNFNFSGVIFPCVQYICSIAFLNKPFIWIASCWVDFATLARATETYLIRKKKKNVYVNFMFYLFLLNFKVLPGSSISNSQPPRLVPPHNDCWARKTNWATPCPHSKRWISHRNQFSLRYKRSLIIICMYLRMKFVSLSDITSWLAVT